MSTIATAPTVSGDMYTRLLLDALPAEAQALVAAGQHVRHVAALYRLTVPEAVAALLRRLHVAADLEHEGQVLTFMEHAYKVRLAHRMPFQVRAGKLVADVPVELHEVQRAVGRINTTRFAGGYRDLLRIISVLAYWLADGDEAFAAEELPTVREAAAYWFEILDFDWRW